MNSNFPAGQAEEKSSLLLYWGGNSTASGFTSETKSKGAHIGSPERGCSHREGAAIRGAHWSLLPGRRGRVPHLTRRAHSHFYAKRRRFFPIPLKSASSRWMPPPWARTPSGPPRLESLSPYLDRARAEPSRDQATSRLWSLERGVR